MYSPVQAEVTVHFPAAFAAPLQVQVPQGQHLDHVVANLVQQHAIPPHLASSVESALATALSEKCRLLQAQQKSSNSSSEKRRHELLKQYHAHTRQYHTKPEEDIFPRAYHTLVHCPIEAIFDTLLGLEQDYASLIQERYAQCEHELEEIQARHNREIESSPDSPQTNMTHLFARHVEEMEVFQATWASDILQIQQTQRREYRLFVVELYREYQARLASLMDDGSSPGLSLNEAERKLDGKDMVKVAAERVRKASSSSSTLEDNGSARSRNRQNSLASLGTASLLSSSSSLPTTNEQTTPMTRSLSRSDTADKLDVLAAKANNNKQLQQYSTMIQDIQEMGFTAEQAETALLLANNNMEQAVMLLVEDINRVNNAIGNISRPQSSQSTPFRRSSSSHYHQQRPAAAGSPAHSRNGSFHELTGGGGGSRRQSLQRNSLPSNRSSKGWSPISFLQQQKQVMENTNLSSVRKLGGWLGRAMENLGIEHDESLASSTAAFSGHPNAQQQPVESFTITLGTAQVKSTHNLRLVVVDSATDIFNPLPYDPAREMAYKAQTATKLYTSHLSAMVVLVDQRELQKGGEQDFGWRQYRSGKGSNKALFERCQHSTEFHFPDIESQLTLIEQDFASRPDGLQEGSFFVTRHSNLPLTQVVFHLIIDSEAAVSGLELSNRHPLIVGLRNILGLVARYDISSLSIPLLLLPDQYLDQPVYPDQQQLAWLQKRGEVVMKCVKGFLSSRSGKRLHAEAGDRAETVLGGGGGLRTVEFLLPNKSTVYGGGNGGGGHSSITESSSLQQQEIVENAFQQFRTLLVNIWPG